MKLGLRTLPRGTLCGLGGGRVAMGVEAARRRGSCLCAWSRRKPWAASRLAEDDGGDWPAVLTRRELVLDVSHTSKTRARAPIPKVGGPQVSVEEGAA